MQNEEDDVSRTVAQPKPPDNFGEISGEEKDWEIEVLRRRLVHYHYNVSTSTYNRIHHNSLVPPSKTFRPRSFNHSTAVWEGETIKLLYAVIDVVFGWASLATSFFNSL